MMQMPLNRMNRPINRDLKSTGGPFTMSGPSGTILQGSWGGEAKAIC